MDDYNIVSLQESNNEWVSRLINLMSPCVIHGIREMLNEALKVCIENDEEEKYLMTFQNILSRVPKWSNETLSIEVERIKNMSKCEYLEDLISCVHIVQLKALTCIRVGQKQKTIDIDVPKFDVFVHKVYTHLARKLFSNVYLFEANVSPLNTQKNNRELELITKDCILEAVRESIPVEVILRAYLDKTIEENVEQEIVHETVEVAESADSGTSVDQDGGTSSTNVSVSQNATADLKSELSTETISNNEIATQDSSVLAASVPTPVSIEASKTGVESTVVIPPIKSVATIPPPPAYETTNFSSPELQTTNTMNQVNQTIKFSDIDEVQNAETKAISTEVAPKDVVSLEKRAEENYQKQLALEEDEDDGTERLKIHNDANIVLDVETL